jgi:hypothetical protein
MNHEALGWPIQQAKPGAATGIPVAVAGFSASLLQPAMAKAELKKLY